jgi:membrane protein involved in colicin uptake
MSQSREERKHNLCVYQKAELERFRHKCEQKIKEDHVAKLIALREATRLDISEETRKIHEQLSNVHGDAYAKAAEEHSKLEQQNAEPRREYEKLVQLPETINSEIQRHENMVTATTGSGDNDDAVKPILWNDPRTVEFQRTPIQDGIVRVGLRWA